MITIRSLFFEICFDKKDYAIYHTDYAADKYGNALDAKQDAQLIEKGQYYEYGNIFIQTGTNIYCLNKVYAAYDWVVELLDYIDARHREENIYIDINKLIKIGEGDDDYREFFCSHLTVETIK